MILNIEPTRSSPAATKCTTLKIRPGTDHLLMPVVRIADFYGEPAVQDDGKPGKCLTLYSNPD
jgi:hypothetical protein